MRTQKGNTHYYYDTANNLIAMVKGNDTLHFYYDSNNSPIAFTRNNVMYYYVKNIQGDIIKIVSENGSLVYTYDYDAWGALISIKDNQGHTISGNSLATTNPLRYRGYVYDDETGLYYLQSRYYDPKIGRFLNADVYFDTGSGSPLSTNMFAYCENCSTFKVDINGENAWWIQAPSSAWWQGHTSLLIQEKPGSWWYFYWSGDTKQLLYIGTTTLNNLNKAIDNKLKLFNKLFHKNLKRSDNYTSSLRFEGNFSSLIKKIKNDFEKQAKNKKLKKYLFYEIIKGKKQPTSWVLYGKGEYNWLFNNCMHKSAYYLSLCSIKKYNSEFKYRLKQARKYPSPNDAYRVMIYGIDPMNKVSIGTLVVKSR